MKFTTGEIISAGTGKLCCPIGRVYVIMNYLTGDNLFTHQLPRAGRVCEPFVRQQHPWINELDISGCTPATWETWLADAVSKYGKEHELTPIPKEEWTHMDPIREAIHMVGKERVMPVILDKG